MSAKIKTKNSDKKNANDERSNRDHDHRSGTEQEFVQQRQC